MNPYTFCNTCVLAPPLFRPTANGMYYKHLRMSTELQQNQGDGAVVRQDAFNDRVCFSRVSELCKVSERDMACLARGMSLQQSGAVLEGMGMQFPSHGQESAEVNAKRLHIATCTYLHHLSIFCSTYFAKA